MSDPPVPEPPRLETQGGPTAQVLRRAEQEASERQLNERAMFRRVEDKRRARMALTVNLCGFLVAATVGLVIERSTRPPDPVAAPDIRAETIATPRPSATAGTPAPTPEPLASVAPLTNSHEPAGARLARGASPRRTTPARSAPAEKRSAAPAPPATEERCRALAGEGETQPAIECFRELGSSSGLASDLALYEAARLSSSRAGDSQRTLALLDEHERRFPASALRVESSWLRVQALRAHGRLDEALAASERLLGAQRDGALAAEVHWLRARILADDRGDCASALSDLVALMGRSGARSDEAEWRRAECLDRLGRTGEAVSAYRHYLKREKPRNMARAEQRLSELSP